MKNGATVAAFEKAFASYVGAKYAIALCNGTATLHTALLALGVKPGDRVAVPPLTMSATTIAVLQAGAVPVFCDVDERTWLMAGPGAGAAGVWIPVSLYGLAAPHALFNLVDDAAQTLRKHSGCGFTSYSFQASKILALGEGGMLVTNDEALAVRARSISSLGYEMRADQPRIDPKVLKSPTFERHHRFPAWNYRMNDLTAAEGLRRLDYADTLLRGRDLAAQYYRAAVHGCGWLTPQYVPEGWTHDYWCYAVATDTPERALWLADEVERQGGERPYPAWRLTYDEPAFKHLAPDADCTTCGMGRWQAKYKCPDCLTPQATCPNAESLQPRLLQFQTNDLASAERNAKALTKAIGAAAPR